jgi:hypothetical protein
MRKTKYKAVSSLLSLLFLSLASDNLLAATLINNSSQVISIANGLNNNSSTHNITPGSIFNIPTDWGDSQHVYAKITANGISICVTQYGLSKLAANETQQITPQLGCAPSSGISPTPEPTPTPPPTPIPSPTPSAVRIAGNGTWIYDAQFLDGPDGAAYSKAGLWSTNLNSYNQAARTGSKITQFFTYGGDLEMYCRGSGEAELNAPCTSKNMLVNYYPPSFYN